MSPTPPSDPDRPPDGRTTREATDVTAVGDEQCGPMADSGRAAYDAAAQAIPQESAPTGAETYTDAADGGGDDSGGEANSEVDGTADSE